MTRSFSLLLRFCFRFLRCKTWPKYLFWFYLASISFRIAFRLGFVFIFSDFYGIVLFWKKFAVTRHFSKTAFHPPHFSKRSIWTTSWLLDYVPNPSALDNACYKYHKICTFPCWHRFYYRNICLFQDKSLVVTAIFVKRLLSNHYKSFDAMHLFMRRRPSVLYISMNRLWCLKYNIIRKPYMFEKLSCLISMQSNSLLLWDCTLDNYTEIADAADWQRE